MLVEAKTSFISTKRSTLIHQGLSILYSQKGNISLDSVEFLALELNEDEVRVLLQRYKATPNEIMDKGENVIQLMEGVVRLSGTIRTIDARDLQAFFDKMGNASAALQKIVDADILDHTGLPQKYAFQG